MAYVSKSNHDGPPVRNGSFAEILNASATIIRNVAWMPRHVPIGIGSVAPAMRSTPEHPNLLPVTALVESRWIEITANSGLSGSDCARALLHTTINDTKPKKSDLQCSHRTSWTPYGRMLFPHICEFHNIYARLLAHCSGDSVLRRRRKNELGLRRPRHCFNVAQSSHR